MSNFTPPQLVEVCRQRYNAIGDTFFSDAELYAHMYTAQCQLVRETLCIERIYTTVSVAGQADYSYPSNTISIKRVTYNGQKLVPITFREDDAITMLNANTADVGQSQFYSCFNNTMYLRPIPDTDDLEIKIYSYNLPQIITSTSVFEIPDLYLMDTVNYVLSEMYAKDKDMQASRYYRDLWNLSLLDNKKAQKKMKRGDAFVAVQDVETLNERVIGNL